MRILTKWTRIGAADGDEENEGNPNGMHFECLRTIRRIQGNDEYLINPSNERTLS